MFRVIKYPIIKLLLLFNMQILKLLIIITMKKKVSIFQEVLYEFKIKRWESLSDPIIFITAGFG